MVAQIRSERDTADEWGERKVLGFVPSFPYIKHLWLGSVQSAGYLFFPLLFTQHMKVLFTRPPPHVSFGVARASAKLELSHLPLVPSAYLLIPRQNPLLI